MSRQHHRSVYVRRRLLLAAAAIFAAWVVVQIWSSTTDEANPTSTATVTALPPTATPAPAGTTPAPTPTASMSAVTLPAGTAACKTRDVTIRPSIKSPQFAQQPVFVDVAITTSASKSCVFTPKPLDPLAVITQDDDTVWDSSICEAAIVAKPVQLVPGWATTIRVPWIPRASGESCSPDEEWLEPDEYTLRVGTLGGEPGRADFTLAEPPPPPTPTPTPTGPVPAPTGTPAASPDPGA